MQYLYALQLIDLSLDELQQQKGDLPAGVQKLEGELAGQREHHAATEHTMRQAFSMRENADNEILTLKAKLEKYKSQQFAVRSNREYDALTREMDAASDSIQRLEKEMVQLEAQATNARTELGEIQQTIDAAAKILEEKKVALAEVSKLTEDEELQLGHARQKARRAHQQTGPRDVRAHPEGKARHGRRSGEERRMRRVSQPCASAEAPRAAEE